MAMQSVLKSLQVLEAVAEHQPVRVGELTPIVGLPKSTVQRSLETLAEAGWLRQVDGDLTRWALTSRAQSVVARSTGEVDLRECALGPMQGLRDSTEETAHLLLDRPVQRSGHRTGGFAAQHQDADPAGNGVPMAGSTAGIAMLARNSDAQAAEAIAHAEAASDNPFEADPGTIKSQVQAARQDGYSCRLGWDKNAMGVGAAILITPGRLPPG